MYSVMQIILRDGTLYFLTIFGVNLMNTLIYFVSAFLLRITEMHLAMCIMYQLAIKDLKAVGARYNLLQSLDGVVN